MATGYDSEKVPTKKKRKKSFKERDQNNTFNV